MRRRRRAIKASSMRTLAEYLRISHSCGEAHENPALVRVLPDARGPSLNITTEKRQDNDGHQGGLHGDKGEKEIESEKSITTRWRQFGCRKIVREKRRQGLQCSGSHPSYSQTGSVCWTALDFTVIEPVPDENVLENSGVILFLVSNINYYGVIQDRTHHH
jgi:hypothetical protein